MKYSLGIIFCLMIQNQLSSMLSLDQNIDLSLPLDVVYSDDQAPNKCELDAWRSDLEYRIMQKEGSFKDNKCNMINNMEPSQIVLKKGIMSGSIEDCLVVNNNEIYSWLEERVVFTNNIKNHFRTTIAQYNEFFIVLSVAQSELNHYSKSITLQLIKLDFNKQYVLYGKKIELFSFEDVYDCPFNIVYVNKDVLICSSPSGKCFVIKNWHSACTSKDQHNIKYDTHLLKAPLHSVKEFKENSLLLLTTYGVSQLLLKDLKCPGYESDAFACQPSIIKESVTLLSPGKRCKSFQVISKYEPNLKKIKWTVLEKSPFEGYSHQSLVLLWQLEKQCSDFQKKVEFMRIGSDVPKFISLHKDWIQFFNELPKKFRSKYKKTLQLTHDFNDTYLIQVS